MGTFKTKARAIELLGKKQIRDSSTALAELMKNSYDADAEILRVEFLTKDIKNSCVVICDNGYGMDKEDIENRWLVLGTDSKKNIIDKKSPGGRTLMGEKGIGRLALSRLGQQVWMFTKKTSTLWNILYLNWNIFENPDLYIQDVNVPVLYNIDEQDFAEAIRKLVYVQKKNLESNLWKTEKYFNKRKDIKKQIEDIDIDLELIYDFCDIISKTKNQGTVLFVFNLEDDWDRYLDYKINVEEDIIAYKNRTRLNSFLSNFAVNEKNFKVDIFLNNQPIELSANFNDADYEIYDLKIEGKVKKGIFTGRLSARNADKEVLKECNNILQKGISVTAGISNWKDSDCGEYTIKLCHFEKERKNSGLADSEFDQIKARMELAGGISVFRDNVRVLPYGEPENDFLELETRRSKGAGYYLFSHRNMFGRIDITTQNNPNLEDKSSREGLLENKYFYYFIKTLQNLLIQIATDYVGDGKPSSLKLRQSYLEHNNKAVEKKERAKQYEKEQKRQFEEELKNISIKLQEGYDKFSILENKIICELNSLRNKCSLELNQGYSQLDILVGTVNNKKHFLSDAIISFRKDMHIYISEKFEHRYDPELLDEVDKFNEKLFDLTEKLKEKCLNECNALQELIQTRIQTWFLQFKKEANLDYNDAKTNLREALKRLNLLNEKMNSEYSAECIDRQQRLSRKVKELEEKLYSILHYDEKLIAERNCMISSVNQELKNLNYRIEQLDQKNVKDVISELNDINLMLFQCEKNFYTMLDILKKKSTEEYEKASEQLTTLLDKFEYDDDEIISHLTMSNYRLKEQMDIYSDLANLGLAAEIVNHEFDQLFTNVYNAINQMKGQVLSNNAKFYLKQIEIGFRAISDRQNQLSPMYRTRGMRVSKVNVREMIGDIKEFFRAKLENQNVSLINDVEPRIEIKISPSKIYPILSNVVYNSLYWVANQEEKIILFHYVEEENALYIEDSGMGISARNKERIFEPFFTMKSSGRGLGLSIARNVLRAQGNDIDVIIESDKKILHGACFRIIFKTEE